MVLRCGLFVVMSICVCRRCSGAVCLLRWHLRIVCLFLYIFVTTECDGFGGNEPIDISLD